MGIYNTMGKFIFYQSKSIRLWNRNITPIQEAIKDSRKYGSRFIVIITSYICRRKSRITSNYINNIR